jgi:probable DNA repair protein
MTIDPLDIAASGGTVLTANKRLARQLVNQFDQRQMSAGQSVWSSPTICSLDAWLMRQFTGLRNVGSLLTEAQSQRLWEEIIAADATVSGRDLLQVSQAAKRARDAHRLLTIYLAEFAAAGADEEHQAFLRWREAWQARLRKDNWLDRVDLLATVTAAFAAGHCVPPTVLVLAGFDDLSPALRQLCNILQGCGCRVESWEIPVVANATATRYDAVDMVDEVRSCARWARLHLERTPLSRIGVVMPQLTDYQKLIEQTFRAELVPSACLAGVDDHETFTLSLGTPLSNEGVICAALRLLAVADSLSMDEIGWLLRSPYLGGAQTEWADRARADRNLRRRGRCEWRLTALPRTFGGIPRMVAIIEAMLAADKDRRHRLPGEWAEHFAGLLENCGWPGERRVTSREYQAIDHFKEALAQLTSLDRVTASMARGEALSVLNRLVAEMIFQPEGGTGHIQVMGMLEAAGFTFDALWVMGLHERAFPAAPRPNPFLPLALQSRMQMPHADAAREREFAGRLADRLFVAAPEIVVSCPGQHDSAALRPSPLIRHFPPQHLNLAPSCDPFQTVLAAPCSFEQLSDDRATPLATKRPFTGGTSILTDQALCPFRAFAHHRLHAEQLDSTDLGLDNQARGILAHSVLERFWQQVRTQEALLELDDSQRNALLTEAAEEAIAHYERRSRCNLPPKLRALELRRLRSMVTGWLVLECARPPFRVAQIEQWHDVTVGRLKLRTRIDRVDELTGGQLAVIDYKTGQPSPRQWLDARVTEPQLPLYCLDLDNSNIGAVLFAMIRSREKECAFRGVARKPDLWPKMSAKNQDKLLAERGWSNFDEVVAHWREALPALGDAFVAGVATVDPVNPQQACRYCDLPALCRIGEHEGVPEADDGEVSADE